MRDRVGRLPEAVRRGAATLWLRHGGPLRAALGMPVAADADADATGLPEAADEGVVVAREDPP